MYTVGDLIKHFRTVTRDDVEPYLWSDDELVLYAADAYPMFARLSGGIADVTSEATQVHVAAGENMATLHPSVLKVNNAFFEDGRPIKVVNYTDVRMSIPSELRSIPGQIRMMVIGEQRGLARFVNAPSEDTTVYLQIMRMPIQVIEGTYDTLDELDPMHHLYLVKWMQHLAYLKQDAETFNPKLSDEAATVFSAYCQRVAMEWDRYKHKTRSVSYGGL
jgi:hypothetical protein